MSITVQEYERRFDIWLDNLLFIDSYNSEDKSHWVRVCYCSNIWGTVHFYAILKAFARLG